MEKRGGSEKSTLIARKSEPHKQPKQPQTRRRRLWSPIPPSSNSRVVLETERNLLPVQGTLPSILQEQSSQIRFPTRRCVHNLSLPFFIFFEHMPGGLALALSHLPGLRTLSRRLRNCRGVCVEMNTPARFPAVIRML